MQLDKTVSTIQGTVDFVLFPKTEDEDEARITKWRAFRVTTSDYGSLGVSGVVGWRPRPNEVLKLTRGNAAGKDDGYYLYQGRPAFRFKTAEHDVPVNERGILHQACEITNGIGPVAEARIWAAKGADWREVTASEAHLSEVVIARFHESIQHLDTCRKRTEAIAFLLSIGCTDHMAEAGWDKWQSGTIAKVQSDPYVLTQLPNYGFGDVDARVAPQFGIRKDDPRRISACTRYQLRRLCESATLCYWSVLCDEIMRSIPDASPLAIENTVRYMLQSGKVVAFGADTATPKVALQSHFAAENAIYDFVQTARTCQVPLVSHIVTDNLDFSLDESQTAAVLRACNSRFTIINGGAGSGKTSIIRAIADTLSGCEICAFAGKAAARLRERTRHHASTIHSMLGYRGEVLGFTRPSLNGVTVIMDESSMVNSELMAEIVRRNPAKLILVGDEAQLPPVGAGSPFHDLIKCVPDCVSTLTTCYRNSEAIYKAAQKVRNAEMPELTDKTANELWEFRATGNDIETHNTILRAVRDGEIDFDRDLVIVCRNGDGMNQKATVDALNIDIKAIVNPAAKGDNRNLTRQLDRGDRVICTENDPETDTWNGTTGRINDFDIAGAMYVELDSPTADGKTSVLIEKSKIKNWSLAYALTVHKSQGSQYRRIYCVSLFRDIHTLLDRSMLYTAMTRATEECHCFGQLQAFRVAIGKAEAKMTCLKELFA